MKEKKKRNKTGKVSKKTNNERREQGNKEWIRKTDRETKKI